MQAGVLWPVAGGFGFLPGGKPSRPKAEAGTLRSGGMIRPRADWQLSIRRSAPLTQIAACAKPQLKTKGTTQARNLPAVKRVGFGQWQSFGI